MLERKNAGVRNDEIVKIPEYFVEFPREERKEVSLGEQEDREIIQLIKNVGKLAAAFKNMDFKRNNSKVDGLVEKFLKQKRLGIIMEMICLEVEDLYKDNSWKERGVNQEKWYKEKVVKTESVNKRRWPN